VDRDRYAGPVGWVDGAGNGTWAVGIRSAIVDGPLARIFAGVGVVAGVGCTTPTSAGTGGRRSPVLAGALPRARIPRTAAPASVNAS
jgi:hypothetical protein